jgi:hypothetical protein
MAAAQSQRQKPEVGTPSMISKMIHRGSQSSDHDDAGRYRLTRCIHQDAGARPGYSRDSNVCRY